MLTTWASTRTCVTEERKMTSSAGWAKIEVAKKNGMRNVIVGTAGHIDHGKTTLVGALTGVDTDRLAEEKRRGISIDLGFAHLPLSGELSLGFVDVPGHERFVKNMLAGASGIDLALLVVAATESIKPQTREHFDICRLLGIEGGVVAITKADLVDPELVELVKLEVAELVAGSFLEGAAIVAVSATKGEGLPALREALADLWKIAHGPPRVVTVQRWNLLEPLFERLRTAHAEGKWRFVERE